MNWTGTAWTQITRGTATASWTWNGTAWMYALNSAMTAATWSTSSNPSYDWNVTITPKFSNTPTIRATIYNDIMLVSNGINPIGTYLHNR